MVHNLELVQNFRVCPKCDHHFTQSARERLDMLLDPDSFVEHDADMTSVDTLKFTGMASYTERLKTYQKKTGLKDAVISGFGKMEGQRLSISAMDFNFIAATMGSVVGEKLTRCVERATQERVPVIIVSASGGARMYEGMLSLLQMAKTCGALALHAKAGLPYISVLTASDDGRRECELRHDRRREYCRAEGDDWLRRAARHSRDDAPGPAAQFSRPRNFSRITAWST
ncbi:MAG: acetyl-CoA carboxylase carboxyltransferase subunit beta [Chthoniobacter sp.]